MRFSLLLVSFLFFSISSSAQPENDECNTAAALGIMPGCVDELFTNIGATSSSAGAAPACFNGGNTRGDVWFSFNTGEEREISVFVIGRPDGPNGRALSNPQIALYRGSCDGLSELACASAKEGAGEVQLDAQQLNRNTTYFLRINDFSATAASNAGDFALCIRPLEPAAVMGESEGSMAYFGTVYDSGGPDGNYRGSENQTFTICPEQTHSCILLDVKQFDIEEDPSLYAGDTLYIFEGDGLDGPLLASLTGNSDGSPFEIVAKSGCVTLSFHSDFLIEFPGFEIDWRASALPCSSSSVENPTSITGLPYQVKSLSTCEGKATFGASSCKKAGFLAGPDYIFTYNSTGSECIGVKLSGATKGTGVAVFDGPPGNAGVRCLAMGSTGAISSVRLEQPGMYYLAVAGPRGCSRFSMSVESMDCALSPRLENALRNPLNGCIREDGLPSVFIFEDGVQDLELVRGNSAGCWVYEGNEADFFWFSVQAQREGQLGFIIQSADVPSDLDVNVWGPFSQLEILKSPQSVIETIASSRPIRSSYAPGDDPTGLVEINPLTNEVVKDELECEDPDNPGEVLEPGALGDDFVRVIEAKPGEVYVTLINDWGDKIENGGIAVDWSPTTQGLLDPLEAEVIRGDTAICPGDSARLEIEIGTNTITWISGTETLSCTDCPDPVATPSQTTTYTAVVESVCLNDTIDITVSVLEVDLGPDQIVCRGETIQLVAGGDFENATYSWTVSPGTGVDLSCTDCPAPLITADQAGAYQIAVELNAEGCTFQDVMTLNVLNAPAPVYEIDERNVLICQGESVLIGVSSGLPENLYFWTSDPPGFTDTVREFTVSPDQTTQYFVEITRPECPVSSIDSILVDVSTPPVLDVRSDTLICVGDTVQLAFGPNEKEVAYTWSGGNGDEIFDRNSPVAKAAPTNTSTYTLTAVRGACEVSESVTIQVNTADLSFPEDTVFVCLGEDLELIPTVTNPTAEPLIPLWSSDDPAFDTVQTETISVSPTDSTIYRAEISSGACFQIDSVLIVVDSLPADLSIMPPDTSICEGQFVILRTPAYETSFFPDIEFQWAPARGQQSPDSLLNMVVTPDTTTTYYRITTNNACRDSTAATVEVKPIAELTVIPSDTLLCFGEEVQFTLMKPGELEEVSWSPMDNLRCPDGTSGEIDCEDPIATAVAASQNYQINAEFDGCPVMASTTVRAQLPPQVNFPAQTVICLGESIQLNSIATPGAEYIWTSTDPNFGTVTDPTPVVSPTETTTYFLSADITDGEIDCQPRMEEITIEVIGTVELEAEVTPANICAGDEVVLRANAIGGSQQDLFLWTTSDGREFEGPEVTDRPEETTTYFLTYRSAGGCQEINRSFTVTVEPGVEVSIETDAPGEVPEGSTVTLDAVIFSGDPGPFDIVWTENGAPIADATGPQVMVMPSEDGTEYTVTVTTEAGCSGSASITFDVIQPEFTVPNAFTPNGDGRNDRFRLLSNGAYDEIVRFQVFNRWGQIVYDNENGPDGWDGTNNGEPQPSDVYTYIIVVRTLGGNEITLQGEVTLLR